MESEYPTHKCVGCFFLHGSLTLLPGCEIHSHGRQAAVPSPIQLQLPISSPHNVAQIGSTLEDFISLVPFERASVTRSYSDRVWGVLPGPRIMESATLRHQGSHGSLAHHKIKAIIELSGAGRPKMLRTSTDRRTEMYKYS